MANSTFRFPIGGQLNGGGARLLDILQGEDARQFALAPECVWRCVLSYQDIRSAGGVESDVATIGGTAPDGDYTLTISGVDADGVAFSEETEAFAASMNTNTQIADGLETLLADLYAPAGPLEDIIASSSQTGAAITVIGEQGVLFGVSLGAPVGATLTNAYTNVLAIDLNVLRPNAAFPANVERDVAMINVLSAFDAVGLTQFDVDLGDTADDDGLAVAVDATTTGRTEDTSAAERTNRVEAAFAPLVTITTDIRATDLPNGQPGLLPLTAGEMVIEIAYVPLPTP